MDIVFSCSDVIKLQVVADSRLDGGTERRSRDIEERKHGAVMSVQCPGLLQEPFLRKLTMMAVNNDVAARRY